MNRPNPCANLINPINSLSKDTDTVRLSRAMGDMDGRVFLFKRATCLLGLEEVGHVPIHGLLGTGECKSTDAFAQAAALADKFHACTTTITIAATAATI